MSKEFTLFQPHTIFHDSNNQLRISWYQLSRLAYPIEMQIATWNWGQFIKESFARKVCSPGILMTECFLWIEMIPHFFHQQIVGWCLSLVGFYMVLLSFYQRKLRTPREKGIVTIPVGTECHWNAMIDKPNERATWTNDHRESSICTLAPFPMPWRFGPRPSSRCQDPRWLKRVKIR